MEQIKLRIKREAIHARRALSLNIKKEEMKIRESFLMGIKKDQSKKNCISISWLPSGVKWRTLIHNCKITVSEWVFFFPFESIGTKSSEKLEQKFAHIIRMKDKSAKVFSMLCHFLPFAQWD